jgi:hypothetical protein
MASPEQVIAAYRSAGYDFLVLTDHFEARWGWAVTDTSAARDASFTTGLTNFLDFDRLPVHHLHAVETYNVCPAVAG